MHRSRVFALLLDAPTGQASEVTAFWSAALGAPARPDSAEPQFTRLHDAIPGLVTVVQAVDDEPRHHLDIETDDVEAETARLVARERPSWRSGSSAECCALPAGTCSASYRCTASQSSAAQKNGG